MHEILQDDCVLYTNVNSKNVTLQTTKYHAIYLCSEPINAHSNVILYPRFILKNWKHIKAHIYWCLSSSPVIYRYVVNSFSITSVCWCICSTQLLKTMCKKKSADNDSLLHMYFQL